jgi:ADP-ribosylglycohydrolase
MNRLEQAQGMLFGLALGDALGWPVEFLSLARIRERYGVLGIRELPEPAIYTDDTQMTLAVAEALIEAGEQDLEGVMAGVSRRFVDWLHDPENNRAPGNTCLYGCRRLAQGLPWGEAGQSLSKGCGAAMRVAPVGYLYRDDPTRLQEVAAATALATHGHPAARLGAVASAYLVKLALDGTPPEDILPALKGETQGRVADFDQALARLDTALTLSSPDAALAHIGPGWVAEEAVCAALYCFLRNPRDFLATVRLAANTDGDSDSLASIAGGLSGASLGVQALPAAWVERIEKSAYLADTARRLAEKHAHLYGKAS